MDAALAGCIAEFHTSSCRWALALTGGGIRLGGWLLGVPGGSRTILEIQTPYDPGATDAYLGRRPESYCSEAMALALARRAQERAVWLAPRQRVAGLGLTASLRSERPKRGEHRVHVAVATDTEDRVWSLTLTKEARSRAEEDEVAARLALGALAQQVGVVSPEVPLLPEEGIHHENRPVGTLLARFLRGEVETVGLLPDGRQVARATMPAVVVPGSFNPLHAGHVDLARVASQRCGLPAVFELSVENVEKPALEAAEVRWRSAAFRWQASLLLTRAPRFLQKARLFPGAVFAVGADTATRLAQVRFYEDDPVKMQAALTEIRELGCRFLVAGRVDANGRFQGLESLPIPRDVQDLFEAIPEKEYRHDISSTEIRQREQNSR